MPTKQREKEKKHTNRACVTDNSSVVVQMVEKRRENTHKNFTHLFVRFVQPGIWYSLDKQIIYQVEWKRFTFTLSQSV